MGSSEKFCLKWNEYTNNLTSYFSDQKANQEFTDVTLACEDQGQLTVHRVILSLSLKLLLQRYFEQTETPKSPDIHEGVQIKGPK